MTVIETILLIIYIALSYWAVGKTIYANKLYIGNVANLFITKLIIGLILGAMLIPIALFKTFILKK